MSISAIELIDSTPYFDINENWGNLDIVDVNLIQLMISLRAYVNSPMTIHSVTTGEHVKNSKHYEGKAVDFSFRKLDFSYAISKVEEWLVKPVILNSGEIIIPNEYCGLGIYPIWNNKGFHLDTRGTKARWGYIYDNDSTHQVAYDTAKNIVNV